MKLLKKDVLAFIDTTIMRLRKEHEASTQRKKSEQSAELATWEATIGPKWDEAAKVIAAARKQHKPITLGMLPTDRYRDAEVFSESDEAEPFKVPRDLAGMRALVQVVTEDTVDMKALSGSDVRDLFRKYAKD